MALTNANTYTGGTVVNAGNLIFSGAGSANQVAVNNEVQQLTFSGLITGGTFTLSYGTNLVTQPIVWSATPATLVANIQAGLNGILGAGNTLVATTATPGVYSVTYQGSLANSNLQPLAAAAGLLTGTSPSLVPSTLINGSGREVQTLTLAGTSGGSFALQYNGVGASNTNEVQRLTIPTGTADNTLFTLSLFGQATAPITYSTTAATTAAAIQSALNTTFGTASLNVVAVNALNFTVTAGGALANTNLPSLVANLGVSEVQTITFDNGYSDGDTYTLTWFGMTTLVPVVFDGTVPANNVTSITAALNSIGLGGNFTVASVDALNYTVSFDKALSYVNVPPITAAVDSSGGTVDVLYTLDGMGSKAQTIDISGSPLDTFTLSLAGQAGTPALALAATPSPTAANVLAHLNSIPGLNGNVSVFGPDAGPFLIVFNNALANTTLPDLTFTVGVGAPSVTITTLGEGIGNEVQTLTLGGTAGTFTSSFNGIAATAAVTFTPGTAPTSAQLLTHLNTIPALSGNVTVFGPNSGPFTIVFSRALAGLDVSQLIASTTGGTTATTATTTDGAGYITTVQRDGLGNEVQRVTIGGAAGTVQLSIGGINATSALTAPFTGLTAAAFQANLTTIAGLSGNVKVFGPTGGPFFLAYTGALANVNMPTITATAAGGATSAVATYIDGSGNEAQTLTLGGTSGGTFTVSYAGVAATSALTFTTGATPTAAALLTNLNTIPLLNGNVSVLGQDAGPYLIVFNNALANIDVPTLTANVTGGTTATPAVVSNGGSTPGLVFVAGIEPTLLQAQAYINSLDGLNGNVTVLAPGGPFTIVFNNNLANATTPILTAVNLNGATATPAITSVPLNVRVNAGAESNPR